jgi:hypothetical protein
MLPPSSIEEYIFDYSRSTGKMRFRLDGEEWLAERLVGQWDFQDVESTGRCHVRCLLQLKGETAYVYLPGIEQAHVSTEGCDLTPHHNHATCQIATANPFPQGRESHWRLCYARELAEKGSDQHWRLRDERSQELWFVKGYKGPVNVNYLDKGSHVFVDGKAFVNEEGVAVFA